MTARPERGVKVAVDAVACVGHGRCYVLAPEVFEDDDRGHCVVVRAEVPPELADRARRAAENCPEGAIDVQDERD